jgi:CrcB protein
MTLFRVQTRPMTRRELSDTPAVTALSLPDPIRLMFATLFQVALGGAIGSSLRYLMVVAVGAPLATALVNIAGSLAMGVLFVTLSTRATLSPLLMTGVLGGFTTFSAFSLDALKLWENGQTLHAAAYVAASVLLSLAAVALGAALARGVLA